MGGRQEVGGEADEDEGGGLGSGSGSFDRIVQNNAMYWLVAAILFLASSSECVTLFQGRPNVMLVRGGYC